MPKAASATTKGTSSSKKTTASKARNHPTAQNSGVVLVSPATPVESGAPPSVEPPILPAAPESPALTSILQRLDTLEEKITGGFAALAQELHTLHVSSSPAAVGTEVTSETVLPLMTDVLRHNLIEHLNPVLAAMKRLEERIGFVANRLKFSGGGGGGSGQDRQKPWRTEQGRPPRPQRSQQNGQRPTPPQPQQWTPPSAASVQGHFAPRPLPGRGFVEEDD
jgi:hypothetical protein